MKLQLTKAITALGLTLAFCLPTTPAHAFIASVKAAGMGQTGVANPQDAEAGAYNPAGMVHVGDRVDVGLSTIHNSQDLTIRGNLIGGGIANGHYDASVKSWYFNPHFGINKMICDNMSLGLVIYNKESANVHYGRPIAILGNRPVGLDFIQECIALDWSWKFNPCHSFGIALDFIAQDLRVRGLQNFATIQSSIFPGDVTNRGHEHSYGWTATFGWQGRVLPCLTLGATFQPEVRMTSFKKYKGFAADRGRINSPRVFKAGLAWDVMPCLKYCLDYTFEGIHSIHALRNSFGITSPETRLGNHLGSGFGLVNRHFIRTGLAYQICDWTLRLGYRWANTPIKSTQTAPNALLMETTEHFITTGATYAWRCMEFSCYYAHGFHHRINGKNSIPVTLGSGDADLEQTKDAFGFSVGYNY